jgi:hypothetical protein
LISILQTPEDKRMDSSRSDSIGGNAENLKF